MGNKTRLIHCEVESPQNPPRSASKRRNSSRKRMTAYADMYKPMIFPRPRGFRAYLLKFMLSMES